MPRAAKYEAASPSLIIVVWITERVRSQISTGLCSTQPARGRICSCSKLMPSYLVAAVVKQHEPGTGGALIDGTDEIGHHYSSGFRIG